MCDYAEIKMKGDTTSMRVLLVVDSSIGHLGATDVDQKGGSSGFAAKWMAKVVGLHRLCTYESAV